MLIHVKTLHFDVYHDIEDARFCYMFANFINSATVFYYLVTKKIDSELQSIQSIPMYRSFTTASKQEGAVNKNDNLN